MAPAGTATSRPLTSQGRAPARSLACGRVLLRATVSRPHPGLAPLGTTGDSRVVGGSRRVLNDRKDATMARTPPIPAGQPPDATRTAAGQVVTLAGAQAMAVQAAASVTLAAVTPQPRYRELARRYGPVVAEAGTCA